MKQLCKDRCNEKIKLEPTIIILLFPWVVMKRQYQHLEANKLIRFTVKGKQKPKQMHTEVTNKTKQ